MAKKSTTIHDIARELGINAGTVSRALNNHAAISEETKKLVRSKAKELNYSINPIASTLRTGKSHTIGLIIPRINRYFFADIISGIESITNPAGYNLIICQSNESYAKEMENINTLVTSRVDGIIISLSSETKTSDHLEKIRDHQIPFVQFDRVIENIKANCVVNDNFQGSYEAVNHLIAQGYKKVAHMGGDFNASIFKNRFKGYKKALKEAGMTENKKWIFQNAITRQNAYEKTCKLLSQKDFPDAFFCSSDLAAHGILLALNEKGIKVPEEVGIVGFANEPFTKYIQPSLSTLNQFGTELGMSAASVLLDDIGKDENDNTHKPQKILIKPQLLIRESSNRNNILIQN